MYQIKTHIQNYYMGTHTLCGLVLVKEINYILWNVKNWNFVEPSRRCLTCDIRFRKTEVLVDKYGEVLGPK